MSINSAMLSGVSGLIANSAALGALSDNISNVNTVGYKRNVTDFQEIVSASAPKGDYNAGGVMADVRQLVSQQGQMQQTSSSTDLAISGSGFFVVTGKASGLTATDARSFTRAGSFTPDSAGFLKNSAGYYLQGWLADPTTGLISPDPSDLTKLSSINISAIGNIPSPSTQASLSTNLNAAQTISGQEATYNPAASATSMAAYTPTSGTGVKPDFSTQIIVYDAQGGSHTLQLDFLKSSAAANTWHAELHAVPASDIAGANNGLISTGNVVFNSDGSLDTTNTTFLSTTTDIGPSSAGAGVRWASALGLPDQKITISLNDVSGSLTQYNSTSVTNSTKVNGGPPGVLTGVTVDADGKVQVAFSNGASKLIGQVALATFPDPNGLRSQNGDVYQATPTSGVFNLKAPSTGGAGQIASNALESSTVDLSTEFTGLIITQRAYAASSKIITTADQMLQELISTKQ